MIALLFIFACLISFRAGGQLEEIGLKAPLRVDGEGRAQTASKGIILLRCPHCANLAMITVPKGTEFTVRYVEPLEEEYDPLLYDPTPTPGILGVNE